MAAKSERSVNLSEDEKKYLLGLIEAKVTLLNVREWMQRLTKENQMPGRQFMKGIRANMGIFV